MILINLLPHREAARKKRQEAFNISLAASALAGGLIAGMIFLWIEGQIASQQDQNTYLNREIKKLDEQIKNIAALEAEIAALRARQQAVENLQADRNLPVHLLSELVRQLPEGVYLVSMRQDNQLVTLQGVAQSNERVSEVLRNFGSHSPSFTRPELIEITSGSVKLGASDQRKIFNFSMRVRLVRSSEAPKAQAAPGGTSAASPAVPAAGMPVKK